MSDVFFSWPDINNFHTVRKLLHKYPELLGGKTNVLYRSKVKLHGTNAAIQVWPDGQLVAQSRTQVITPEADNQGFARWVHENPDWTRVKPGYCYFGEWCGPGINKGCAVHQIAAKMFAVFAAMPLPIDLEHPERTELIVEPSEIRTLLAFEEACYLSTILPQGTFVIPWYGQVEDVDPGGIMPSPRKEFVLEEVTVPWLDPCESLEPLVAGINEKVLTVEREDPLIRELFGVSGVGEELVYYPVVPPFSVVTDFGLKVIYPASLVPARSQRILRKTFSDLALKAKGEKHQVVAAKQPVQVDPTVAATAQAFAELVCPVARLQQGAGVVSPDFDMKLVGPFLKWVNQDVLKECQTELEASGLDPKVAMRAVETRARNWYRTESVKS